MVDGTVGRPLARCSRAHASLLRRCSLFVSVVNISCQPQYNHKAPCVHLVVPMLLRNSRLRCVYSWPQYTRVSGGKRPNTPRLACICA